MTWHALEARYAEAVQTEPRVAVPRHGFVGRFFELGLHALSHDGICACISFWRAYLEVPKTKLDQDSAILASAKSGVQVQHFLT